MHLSVSSNFSIGGWKINYIFLQYDFNFIALMSKNNICSSDVFHILRFISNIYFICYRLTTKQMSG